LLSLEREQANERIFGRGQSTLQQRTCMHTFKRATLFLERSIKKVFFIRNLKAGISSSARDKKKSFISLDALCCVRASSILGIFLVISLVDGVVFG
jgi:hypothetical protein